MRDFVHELDGLAIGMASPSLARDTVSGAAREIERLRADIKAAADDMSLLIAEEKIGKNPTAGRIVRRLRSNLQ